MVDTNSSSEPKAAAPERSATSPGPRLVQRRPDGSEATHPLGEVVRLGRHPKNDLRLNDREISKEHALIERRGASYWIRDLNSSNGTYVNQNRVRESRLHDGDEVQLGGTILTFRFEPGTRSARDLVTILPQKVGDTTHIHAKIDDAPDALDFLPAASVTDVEVLRRDYEKLRVANELTRLGLTVDLEELLSKTLDVVFSILPADNAVILLADEESGELYPHTVRQRQVSSGDESILLSSTIVNQVFHQRASLLSSDAFMDPRFSGSQSIIAQGIRAAMAVPLVAHDRVFGMMHLDSRQRAGAFSEKDLQLLKAIAVQTAIAIENARLVRQIEREAQTRGQLSRFLPPHVVDEMVQGQGQPIQKGGRVIEASVVFCDIRGFTRFSESSGPQEVVDLLNEYFERLVEIVFRRRGVLDKFIGDALMASWGTLPGDADPTYQCVAAAVDFRDAIRAFNADRTAMGLAPVDMGVGVNTGRLVAGYIGAKRRLEYTVIGDAVNTASRLCGMAQGDQVLISEATHRAVADRVEANYLGVRQVKGKTKEIGVYDVAGILDHTAAGS